MTSTLKKRIAGAIAAAIVAAVSYAAGAAQGKPVNMAIGNITWEPIAPGSPVQIAILWGDRTKGKDYGMLLRLPPGSEAGRHSHTADYHAVGVKGTWVHSNDGDSRWHELLPGSYAMQPGKQVHNDACKGTGECIIFVHQHAPGDSIPAK